MPGLVCAAFWSDVLDNSAWDRSPPDRKQPTAAGGSQLTGDDLPPVHLTGSDASRDPAVYIPTGVEPTGDRGRRIALGGN